MGGAAQIASLSGETPEGRSIVVLAKDRHGSRATEAASRCAVFVPFAALTRMSGVDFPEADCRIRKGASEAVAGWVRSQGSTVPDAALHFVERVASEGGTPLMMAENDTVLGVVHLKDIVKGGIKERFEQLRKRGIRTAMTTGDNLPSPPLQTQSPPRQKIVLE